jgi:hypothetical protein
MNRRYSSSPPWRLHCLAGQLYFYFIIPSRLALTESQFCYLRHLTYNTLSSTNSVYETEWKVTSD